MACPGVDGVGYYPLPSACAGSGPPPEDPCCGDELAAFPDLSVTIPDGINAGTWPALWDVVNFYWSTEGLGDGRFRMVCIGGAMTAWMTTDEGTTVAASASDCDPLLFTFPGTIFGATGDVTVEL
jgi:hypothetical protein